MIVSLTIVILSLEKMVDLGMHVLPVAAIVVAWLRYRKVNKEGAQFRYFGVIAFSVVTIAYLGLFLFDVLSLRSAALSDKVLFSRLGIAFIYLNLGVGGFSIVANALRSSPLRRYFLVASILVASICIIDLVRAADVGL
jgi:hypothetical protein